MAENFVTMMYLVYQQVPFGAIKIKWYVIDETFNGVYAKYIANNANGIRSIFKFERIVLQTITKFVIGYISNILTSVIYLQGDVNENCNTMTIYLH